MDIMILADIQPEEVSYYADKVYDVTYDFEMPLTAVLSLEPIAFKKHKDKIAYFNKHYVHTGIFVCSKWWNFACQ